MARQGRPRTGQHTRGRHPRAMTAGRPSAAPPAGYNLRGSRQDDAADAPGPKKPKPRPRRARRSHPPPAASWAAASRSRPAAAGEAFPAPNRSFAPQRTQGGDGCGEAGGGSGGERRSQLCAPGARRDTVHDRSESRRGPGLGPATFGPRRGLAKAAAGGDAPAGGPAPLLRPGPSGRPGSHPARGGAAARPAPRRGGRAPRLTVRGRDRALPSRPDPPPGVPGEGSGQGPEDQAGKRNTPDRAEPSRAGHALTCRH